MAERNFEPKCKICTSKNRIAYEEEWQKSAHTIPWVDFEKKATDKGEEISRKAFWRHFTLHYIENETKVLSNSEKLDQAVQDERKEAINIVNEIRGNLDGLRKLLDTTIEAYKGKSDIDPSALRVLTEIYREHRASLESCERLTSKLQVGTTMSEVELVKILYFFAKNLCLQCRTSFLDNLEKHMKEKGIVSSN